MSNIFEGTFLAFITLLIVIVFIIKIISENRTKRVIIEKGKFDENIKYFLTASLESYVPSSLKWGLVLLGIGLAIILGQIVPIKYQSVITFGGMFVFAGIGFLVYYFVALKEMKKKSKQNSEIGSQKAE